MLSGKQRDFELFADICARMTRRAHCEVRGFSEIVRLANAMNPSGKRGYSVSQILGSDFEMKA
jgi:hypothetical protein